ncbi:hypothetical protein [Aquincola agrisoli]|uniref:hypothetical protein n=1 Tax=Aquincola TaxID=391952 RepID=UPI0036119668
MRAKLVEPGYGPTTRFTANGQQRMQGLVTEPYAHYAQGVFARFAGARSTTTPADAL